MSATFSAPPSALASPPSVRRPDREAVLAAVLDPSRLPTPPAVALQVVSAASRADCDPAEIVTLLSQDPALCAKLLKAVNSCLYGLSKPVASLDRAITILGLGPVRSLVLGLSLPAVRGGIADESTRAYHIASVAGAIVARDLSARNPRGNPSDDMVAGLLRDLGAVLLRQTYPAAWREMTERWGDRLLVEQCEAEEETFGISHADVTAELLRGWNLPPDLIEPIRCHHHPERLAGAAPSVARRAELLCFAGLLANLDTVVRHPDLLDYVLTTARVRFGMARPDLVRFMEGVVPKIVEFGELLNRDVRDCPNFAEALSAGGQELVNLAVENSRTRLSGSIAMSSATRVRATSHPASSINPRATAVLGPGVARLGTGAPAASGIPEFRTAFLDEFPAGGCRLGEYELRAQLGRGAMGVVYKAYEPSLARFVAVKMLAPQLSADATARQRFIREARSAAAIQHESVVGVYAVREANGLPYLAMEYVDGQTLDTYVPDAGPLAAREIARIARQVAAGLRAAHAKGIVHRDVKPGNVLVETGTGTGRAKLTDFGLARAADDAKLSQDGALIGTPHFMSPEQIHGQQATPLSDLFALGGVMYALATGEPPFPGNTLASVFRSIDAVDPVPLRTVRPDLPAWLDEIVLRLLRKKPAERFQSADEVVSVLAKRAD